MSFYCIKCGGVFLDCEKPKEFKHLREVVINQIKTIVTCDAKPEDIIEIIECRLCGNDSTVTYVNPDTKLCQSCQSNEDYYEHEAVK
jgi:hypothetical protein